MTMAPMNKKAEKEGGKKKMITLEVKNGSASRATARGYGDLVRKRQRHPSLQMCLDRRQKQVSLDRFLVIVTQREEDSTDSSHSVSDNESRPTQ
jgi:hypothetical protein